MIGELLKKRKRRIYLDYAAATPVDPKVQTVIQKSLSSIYGNPGSLHVEGVLAKKELAQARAIFVNAFDAREEEIIFTASGTESNNLAILGVVSALKKTGMTTESMHFITSTIEHSSVLECFKMLEGEGASVTYIPVDVHGSFNVGVFKDSLTETTVLVSLMSVNNEIGTIEPIAEILEAIVSFRKACGRGTALPYFHTDASQAYLLPPFNPRKRGIDLFTLDAQKMYGPKGVGMLYRRGEITLEPILRGGDQEHGIRPGTENVPLIVGFAKAFECMHQKRERESKRLGALRDYFIAELKKEIPGVVFNGPVGENIHSRIANNINISLPGIDNEFIVIALNEKGIAIGTASACVDKSTHSYVIKALGKSDDIIKSSLRFSLGTQTTKNDLSFVVQSLKHIVANFDSIRN